MVLTRKRNMVLAALGLPDRPEFLTMLGKIPAASLRLQRIAQLAEAYRAGDDAVLDRLHHLPRLNAGVLGIIAAGLHGHATYHLLQEVGRDHREDDHAPTARLLRAVIDQGRQYWRDRSPVFNKRAILADAAQRLRDVEAPLRGIPLDERFPDLGVPDAAVIGAVSVSRIMTPRALVQFGLEQGHCAGDTSHVARAQQGSAYYVVTYARNSALCEINREHERLIVTELRGPYNKAVPEPVWDTLRKWLCTVASGLTRTDNVPMEVVIAPPF